MKDVFISICSGLVGVLLTIGYQHFFGQPQSFTFINNGEEMIVTESDYTKLIEQNKTLQNENRTYISDLEDANKKITELQNENNSELVQLKQQYNNEINSKYDVDFQNINLIINGIDTKYNNKVAIINDETFYSMGFLQYLVDNENISENNKKLFIGDIQSEEQMPISLFDFGDPFTAGKLIRTTDDKDFFNEIEDGQPEFQVVVGTLYYDDIRNVTEYYIAGKYTKFTFKL